MNTVKMPLQRAARRAIAVALTFISFSNAAFAQIEVGAGHFEFSEYAPLENKKIRVFYYRPTGNVTEMPILFVMHGVLRNADEYRDNWIQLADHYKVLVIVPEFTTEHFPGSRAYNFGNVQNKDGQPVAEKDWSYSLIDPIFDAVVRHTGSDATGYDLFGHSAGSQFAHRLFFLKTNTRADRIVASNAGSYMMPTLSIDFPFGLGKTAADAEQLKKALSKQLIVQLGEADNDPDAPYLPKGRESMKQGAHRFERGINFYNTARELAEKEGVSFNWKIRTVPGVGHENGEMAVDAAAFLYGNGRGR